MDHLRDYLIKKTKTKEEAVARQRERKRVEMEWRRAIEHVLDRYQAATPEDIAACVGVNPFPQTPQERTALRSLYRRLERGTLHGRYRSRYEYEVQQHGAHVPKAKQRTFAGRVWYISRHVLRKEGEQFEHKAFIMHTRATLERAFEFDSSKTDAEMREDKEKERKGSLIYDFYAVKGLEDFSVECSLTNRPVEISKKCQEWLKQPAYYFEGNSRYLWVAETEWKARNIQERWRKDGLTSGKLLVTWADQFTPYRPESILEPIWLWAKDDQLQALRRPEVE
jgi:hypothetical protein